MMTTMAMMAAVVVLMVVDGGMNRAGARRSDASGARSGEMPEIP